MKKPLLILLASSLLLAGCSHPSIEEVMESENIEMISQEDIFAEMHQNRPLGEDGWKIVLDSEFEDNSKTPGINFQYPADWTYKGGLDMDHGSLQIMKPGNTTQTGSIEILHWSNYGCPSTPFECSLDQTILKSPIEKQNELIFKARERYEISVIETMDNIGQGILYEHRDGGHNRATDKPKYPSITYLFLSNNNQVFDITFEDTKSLGEDFIQDFLSRIELVN